MHRRVKLSARRAAGPSVVAGGSRGPAPSLISPQRVAYPRAPRPAAPPGHSVAVAQRRPSAQTPAAALHGLAARGVEGAGEKLPHLDRLQQSFGRHDLSGVPAFRGAPARRAAAGVDMPAYTAGGRVAFRDTSPDLHTAAHEAAHAVQQRGGLRLPDGVGRRGDAHERNAESVAAKVVRGESAEAELDRYGPAGAVAGSALQGLTGFEVELHEPVYTTPGPARKPDARKNESKVTPAIEAFLGGGLRYGRKYGVERNNLFELSADHGSFATLHHNLVVGLKKDGYLPGDWKFVSMTNVEYITPPVEEREERSATKTNEIIEAVTDHATATEEEAKKDGAQDVPEPALDLKTGIPKSDLTAWIDSGDSDSVEALNALKSYKGYVYHQVTTGVLPSEVPELFEQGAKEVGGGPLDTLRKTVVSKLLTESVRVGKETVEDSAAHLSSVADTRPIRGWLTLVAQYLLASKTEATDYTAGGTAKNLVPYLSKTDLTDSIQALPTDSRPSLTEDWKNVFRSLYRKAKAVDVLAWSSQLSERESPNEVLKQTWERLLTDLLKGEKAKVVGPGSPLGLDVGQESLSPGLKIGGQQAIPLEDRFATVKGAGLRDPANLKKTLTAEFRKALERRYKSAGKSSIDLDLDEIFESGVYKKEKARMQIFDEMVGRLRRWLQLLHGTGGMTTEEVKKMWTAIKTRLVTVRDAVQAKKKTSEAETAWNELKNADRNLYEKMQAKQKEINQAAVAKTPELTEEGYV